MIWGDALRSARAMACVSAMMDAIAAVESLPDAVIGNAVGRVGVGRSTNPEKSKS